MVDNAIQHMDQNLDTIQTLQDKISSTKEVQNLSDDPSAASTVLSMRSILKKMESFKSAANVANDWMSATEESLAQMIEVGTRAGTNAKNGVSDTQGASERLSLASEMDAMLGQAIQLANSSHQDKYIFAGFQVRPATTPFVGVDLDADGQFEAVNYAGDAGVMQQEIGPGQSVTTNIQGPGSFTRLFQGMIQARDALAANDVPTLQTAVATLTAAMDDLNTARTTNGARQRQLEASLARMTTANTDMKNLLSKKEDTDMAEAISLLTYQQTVYQTTLQVSQRAIATVTLFDYLK
jgi:flagellar hook-associated protein 3 FlgL